MFLLLRYNNESLFLIAQFVLKYLPDKLVSIDVERSVSQSDQSKRRLLETVKAYGKRLFGFIRKKVKSDQDAEDILQDVWYQLAGIDDEHEIDQMSGWLFQVARNKIIDKYRKKKPDSLEDHSHISDDGELVVHDLLTQQQDTPETEYLRELFWEELFEALEELPENQRQVFIWNELEDLTLQEIADKTGEKLKTIISRKGYAVKHLREKLEALYLDLFDE